MSTQTTLTGKETEDTREKPQTFLWCSETEQWVLRSSRPDWPHTLYNHPEEVDDSSSTTENENEEEDDEPERVGSIYEIELSYNVDFRFRIPAWSEHEAKERAGDLVDCPNNCADMFQVHSDDRELKELFEDDDMIPDDWDPYGGTPLWEVFGESEK